MALIAATGLAAIAPFLVLAAVAGGLAFVFCCSERRFKYALFALAAYTPFEEFLLKWIPDDLFFYARFGVYGFMAAGMGVILLRRLVEGRPLWIRTPLDLPLALFLLVSLFSLVVNEIPFGAFLFSYQPMLRFVVLAFYAVQFVDFSERDTRRLLLLLAAVVTAEALIGMAQSAIGLPASEFLAPTVREFMGFEAGGMTQLVQEGHFNVFGTMNRYNTLGAFMAMAIVMSIPFYPSVGRRGAIRYLVFLLVAGVCLVLANARAPWLGLAIATCFIFAMQGKLKAVVLPMVGALLVYAALIMFADQVTVYGWDETNALQRFLEPFSGEYRQQMTRQFGRIYYMTLFPFDLLAYQVSTFLIGFGPGSLGTRAQDIYDLYALTPLGIMREWQFYVCDVNWAYILGQVGLVGLSIFVWGLLRIFAVAVKTYRYTADAFLKKLALGYAGLFVLAMVLACFFPMFEMRPLSLYFWLFGGILLKLVRQGNPSTQTIEKPVDNPV